MSDDLGRKIQQIAEMLGQDSVPDNVKEMIAMLATSMASKSDTSGKNSIPSPADIQEQTTSEDNPAGMDSEQADSEKVTEQHAGMDAATGSDLMTAARKALSKMNSANDPRVNLLNAIRPFMNNRRRKKIGNCIQLLQVASLSRLLNETDHPNRK